jgi:hypothetical protein
MSKRCELQKEYYKEYGNYKGDGKYSDDYVKWLENKYMELYNEKCNICGVNIADLNLLKMIEKNVFRDKREFDFRKTHEASRNKAY